MGGDALKISTFLMSLLLLYPENRWRMDVLRLNLAPYCHVSSHMWHSSKPPKNSNHTSCCHRCNVLLVIAMLTMCYSILSHATLMLFYHASMLTLHNSLMSHILWLTVKCTTTSITILTFDIHHSHG
jgi:hypothetical protein